MTALACEFGWTEEYILALPLKRANQYYHALLRRANWRTYAPEAFDVQEQVATLEGDRAETEVAMPVELAAAMARWGIGEAEEVRSEKSEVSSKERDRDGRFARVGDSRGGPRGHYGGV